MVLLAYCSIFPSFVALSLFSEPHLALQRPSVPAASHRCSWMSNAHAPCVANTCTNKTLDISEHLWGHPPCLSPFLRHRSPLLSATHPAPRSPVRAWRNAAAAVCVPTRQSANAERRRIFAETSHIGSRIMSPTYAARLKPCSAPPRCSSLSTDLALSCRITALMIRNRRR
jgi:hypothetical protein